MNATLTYQGCDWLAKVITTGAEKPNCIYGVYTNDSTATALTITADMNASDFAGLSGNYWYCRSTGKLANYVTQDGSAYNGNSAMYSAIISSSDVVSGSGKPAYGDTSKLVAVALVYAEDVNDPSKDVVIYVSNLMNGSAFSPIPVIPNMDISLACPLTFKVGA